MTTTADTNMELFVTLPEDAQQPFSEAMRILKAGYPQLFGEASPRVTMCERSYTLTAEGGAFIAAAIHAAIALAVIANTERVAA